MEKEFIDLGCGMDAEPAETAAPDVPKKSYPCFYFTCDEKIDLPDGLFKFMAMGRKVDSGENVRDPEDPRYRYEIEVQGFKTVKTESGDMKVSLGEKIGEAMKKKASKGEEY